jgi:hypothetical protein
MSTRIDPKEKLAGLLEGCTLQALASNEWLERRIMPLFIDQLRWRPRPGSWSIAETLDHLNRTFSYYLPKIEEALDTTRGTKKRAHRLGESEEMFLRQMEPPIVEPMSAPSPVLPGSCVDPDQVVEQFPLLRNQFAKIVRSVIDVDPGVSISDSLYPPVQSLGGAIGLLAAHERRHLWQAQQILCASEFLAYFAKPPLGDCSRL